MTKFVLCLFMLLGTYCFTQSVYRPIPTDNNIFLHYENDLFARTDRYYTQGFQVGVNYFPKVCFWGEIIKHYELKQDVYTPSSIKSDSLLNRDRPYAATLSVKVEEMAIYESGFSSMIGTEFGIIGPAAGGKQMQTGIHKATNNFLPLGWQHQINNGLIADVYVQLEKRMINLDSVFQLVAGVTARGGTFRTHLNPTMKMIFGNQKTNRIHGYWQNALLGVIYDGSLQGSLIAKESEYVLSSTEIIHFVFQSELGFEMKFNKVGIAFNYGLQSKTFRNQLTRFHSWGGVTLSCKF